MMKWLACLLAAVCSILAFALPARACDTITTATLQSTCVVMERNGQKGVWFVLDARGIPRKTFKSFLAGNQLIMRNKWQLISTPFDETNAIQDVA